MAQAVSRRPLTADACVGSQTSVCEICGRQRGICTGFSPRTSVFSVHCHSTNVPYLPSSTYGSFGSRGTLNRKVLSLFSSLESLVGQRGGLTSASKRRRRVIFVVTFMRTSHLAHVMNVSEQGAEQNKMNIGRR